MGKVAGCLCNCGCPTLRMARSRNRLTRHGAFTRPTAHLALRAEQVKNANPGVTQEANGRICLSARCLPWITELTTDRNWK